MIWIKKLFCRQPLDCICDKQPTVEKFTGINGGRLVKLECQSCGITIIDGGTKFTVNKWNDKISDLLDEQLENEIKMRCFDLPHYLRKNKVT